MNGPLRIGCVLVLICWPLNWLLGGSRSHWLFFPLWLGYVLVVDGLVLRRRGSSLASRCPRTLSLLFVVSVPTWWMFELLNSRLGNWEYLGGAAPGSLEHLVAGSLAFSTVIPAVFETAELVASVPLLARCQRGPRVRASPLLAAMLAALGGLMLILLLLWPRLFFPLTWIWLVLLLDPVARVLGRPSLLGYLAEGRWRPLVALALGALTCGLFWELWNFYAWPKWVYHVPAGVDFAHIFEMPLLGYLGYLPFGLELYPVVQLFLPRPPELRL